MFLRDDGQETRNEGEEEDTRVALMTGGPTRSDPAVESPHPDLQ